MIVIALSIGSAASAQSQDDASRAKILSTARDQKTETIAPPTKSMTERVLHWYDNRDSKLSWQGFHLNLGNFSGGAGFAAGVGFTRHAIGSPIVDPNQANRIDLDLSAGRSILGYQRLSARVDVLNVASAPINISLLWRDDQMPQEDFYGLGPDSLEDDRSNFAQRETFVRVTPAVRRGYLTAGVNLGYLDPSIGSGTDTTMPSTDEIFGPEEVPGLDAQPAFGVIEPFVEFATLDRAIDDRAGGRYRVTFTRYADLDLDQFSFNAWNVDLRQFIPFVHDTHTVALHAWASANEPSDTDSVPFYLQPTLGGSKSLRGFRTFRFRDRSALLMQAEYRWRINEFVTGAVFYDTGAVAPALRDIGRLERDYGFGLRIGSRSTVAFRTDIAFGGREGTRFLVRFNDVF